jgi:TusA-related sulfurtransferase
VIPQVLEKLAKAEKGTTVDVLVDCPSAIDEIPGILSTEGYSVNTTQIGDGEYRIRAEK